MLNTSSHVKPCISCYFSIGCSSAHACMLLDRNVKLSEIFDFILGSHTPEVLGETGKMFSLISPTGITDIRKLKEDEYY